MSVILRCCCVIFNNLSTGIPRLLSVSNGEESLSLIEWTNVSWAFL
jgi:hypothetical protein